MVYNIVGKADVPQHKIVYDACLCNIRNSLNFVINTVITLSLLPITYFLKHGFVVSIDLIFTLTQLF